MRVEFSVQRHSCEFLAALFGDAEGADGGDGEDTDGAEEGENGDDSCPVFVNDSVEHGEKWLVPSDQ